VADGVGLLERHVLGGAEIGPGPGRARRPRREDHEARDTLQRVARAVVHRAPDVEAQEAWRAGHGITAVSATMARADDDEDPKCVEALEEIQWKCVM